jgi:hypothetical protein
MKPASTGLAARIRVALGRAPGGRDGGAKLAVVAWSVGVVSVAGFAAAWVLAARNRASARSGQPFGVGCSARLPALS